MKYLKKIVTFHPTATKIRDSEELEKEVIKTTKESKRHVRIQHILKTTRIFFFGTSLETYEKPKLTSTDIFFILMHLHANIRISILYMDLSFEWGAFLVWVTYSLMNIVICPCLAFLYTFLGDYGDRPFISIWDMNPFFQGISICMFVFEAFKVIEMALILSSGIESIKYFSYIESNDENAPPFNCTETIFTYRPGQGLDYGASGLFTYTGYSKSSNNFRDSKVQYFRVRHVIFIWCIVMFIRAFGFRRYRIFPVRISPILNSFMSVALMTIAVLFKPNPAETVFRTPSSNYGDLTAYLQVIGFALSEYLPGHWITIGYLSKTRAIKGLIWITSFLKIMLGFTIIFGIPFFLEDLRTYGNVTNDTCLHSFGIHIIFIVIPLCIRRLTWKYIDVICYGGYMLFIILNGICYIVMCIEMLSFAVNARSTLAHRFRNLIYMLTCLALLVFSCLLSVDSIHYVLFYLNFRAHYYTIIALFVATITGIAIYGLERINSDHHFLFGTVYGHLHSTQVLFIFTAAITILHTIDIVENNYRVDNEDHFYPIIHLLTVFPFTWGCINTCVHKKSYHGFMHPLPTWGRPNDLIRTGRRRKNLRQLFIYRTRRKCSHSCLLNHEFLAMEVTNEILLRRQLLYEYLDMHNLISDDILYSTTPLMNLKLDVVVDVDLRGNATESDVEANEEQSSEIVPTKHIF